ncbi:MAG: hypothetical protein ACE367_16740 [Acidimicrobiales bacterium]
MTETPVAPPSAYAALRQLRRHVRTRRRGNVPRTELAYRAYVTVLLALFGFYLLLGIIDDAPIGADEIAWVGDNGAAWIGLLAAVGVAAGIRSGASGGPLAIDEADLHHLIMSPLDRRRALRQPVLQLLAIAAGLGAVLGAAAGELAERRLPGATAEWVASGALAGVTITVGAVAAALVSASIPALRRRPVVATLAAIAVVAWAVVDITAATRTAPTTLVGNVALWPLSFGWLDVAAPVVVLAAAVFGSFGIARMSIERAMRRAHLVRQVRFALAQQDIRALILLRRQLGFERPRRRPLFDVGPGRFEDRLPVLYRDVRSYLRWPAQRWVRVGALAALAGLATAGVWEGTTALAGGVAAAWYLIALEVVEPFAQELDHPSLLELAPVARPPILLGHVASAAVLATGLWMVAGAVAVAITASTDLLVVLAITAVPAAAATVGGGAISIKQIGAGNDTALMMPSEMAGPQAVIRLVWPIALAGLGVLPVILGRNVVERGDDLIGGVAPAFLAVALLAALIITWIRVRDDVMAAAATGAGR